jgi:thiol peroxidase
MPERTGVVTVGGNPVTLTGNEINVGDKAPDFEAVDNDMKPVRFSSFDGKVRIIASVASLDTATCDVETRRFNTEAAGLGDDVAIVTISMDLPFAQKRWCGAAGIDSVTVLSDHRAADFGNAYGVLIKETRLLARAIFVVDQEGVVRYTQIVKELSQEPDYSAALKAAKELI